MIEGIRTTVPWISRLSRRRTIDWKRDLPRGVGPEGGKRRVGTRSAAVTAPHGKLIQKHHPVRDQPNAPKHNFKKHTYSKTLPPAPLLEVDQTPELR
jgi:hypothetical protein